MWRFAARLSRFLPPFVFDFFFFFLRLYSVRAAIDIDTRCSYTRLHPVQQTNLQLQTYRSLDVSAIHIMLVQQSTGTVIRRTRYDTNAVVALYVFIKITD